MTDDQCTVLVSIFLSKDQRALGHLAANDDGYTEGLLHLEKRSDRSLFECALRIRFSGGFIGCKKGLQGTGSFERRKYRRA